MTDDLVKRLRAPLMPRHGIEREAADRIEQLEAELTTALAICEAQQTECEKLRADLAAERERAEDYRASLSALALFLSVGSGDETTTAQQYHDRIFDGIDMLATKLTADLAAERVKLESAQAFIDDYDKRLDAALAALKVAREALGAFAEYSIPKGGGTAVIEVMLDDLRAGRAALAQIDKALGGNNEPN